MRKNRLSIENQEAEPRVLLAGANDSVKHLFTTSSFGSAWSDADKKAARQLLKSARNEFDKAVTNGEYNVRFNFVGGQLENLLGRPEQAGDSARGYLLQGGNGTAAKPYQVSIPAEWWRGESSDEAKKMTIKRALSDLVPNDSQILKLEPVIQPNTFWEDLQNYVNEQSTVRFIGDEATRDFFLPWSVD